MKCSLNNIHFIIICLNTTICFKFFDNNFDVNFINKLLDDHNLCISQDYFKDM